MSITTYAELKTAVSNYGHKTLTSRVPEFIALCEDRIAYGDPNEGNGAVRVRAMETQAYVVWRADLDGGTVGGTANAITLSYAATAYAYGDSYSFTATAANTGATTVAVGSAGTKDLKKIYGGVKEALGANDIIDDAFYRIYYDGTDFLLSPEHGALLPTNFLEQRILYLDSSNRKEIIYYPPDAFWSQTYALNSGTPLGYTIEGDWALSLRAADAAYFAKLDYYRRFTRFSADADVNWLLTNAPGTYLYGSLLEMSLYVKDQAGAMQNAMMFEDAVDRINTADKRARIPPSKMQVRVVGTTP